MDTSIPSSSVIAPTDVVAAMFETYVEAVSARETLVAAGIDAGAIDIVDQAASVPAPAPGTWNMLRERLVPEHHAHGYAEGIDRGHALLFVREAPAQQFRVMHLLEGLKPIDGRTPAGAAPMAASLRSRRACCSRTRRIRTISGPPG